MCLNSSGLRSTDNIKFDSDSVDVFLDTCVTAGATPFKTIFFLIPSFQQLKIWRVQGGKLTIYGYGSISYHVQTYDGSKVTIKVNNQPFVPNLNFRLLAPQQIATDEKNNKLPEHE